MGAFTRKWRPEEMVKPECFYIGSDEEWTVMGRKVWAKGSKLGEI